MWREEEGVRKQRSRGKERTRAIRRFARFDASFPLGTWLWSPPSYQWVFSSSKLNFCAKNGQRNGAIRLPTSPKRVGLERKKGGALEERWKIEIERCEGKNRNKSSKTRGVSPKLALPSVRLVSVPKVGWMDWQVKPPSLSFLSSLIQTPRGR